MKKLETSSEIKHQAPPFLLPNALEKMNATAGLAAASRIAKQIQVHRTVDSFRAARKAVVAGKKVGFVPTMGALHEGMPT